MGGIRWVLRKTIAHGTSVFEASFFSSYSYDETIGGFLICQRKEVKKQSKNL